MGERDESDPRVVAAELRANTFHNAAQYVLQQAADLAALRARVARLEGALETVAIGMTREDFGATTVTPPLVRCIERLRNIARAALAPDAARKEGDTLPGCNWDVDCGPLGMLPCGLATDASGLCWMHRECLPPEELAKRYRLHRQHKS